LTGDGRIWALIAESDIASQDFWLACRPFTLPLFYKLLGGSDQALVWFQSVVAILSWGLLAYAIAGLLPSPMLSVLGLLVVLALGLTSLVHGFDLVVRTESLGTSFLVLSLAATLCFTASEGAAPLRKYSWLGVALASAVLSAFARETNGYFLPLLALFVAVECWRKHRRAALALSLGLVLTTLGASISTHASGRYDGPLMNVIFKRVLPAPAKLAYFRDELGMPVSRELMARTGEWASSDGSLAYISPKLASLREWLRSRGYVGDQRYLLNHLLRTGEEAYRALPAYVRAEPGAMAPSVLRANRRSANLISNWADSWLARGPISRFPIAACLAIFGVSVAFSFSAQARSRLLAHLALLCWFGALSQAYVCYHGDVMEVLRHGLIVGVLFRLAVLTSSLAALALLLPHALRSLRFVRRRADAATTAFQSAVRR
jgi:hypothetical protein